MTWAEARRCFAASGSCPCSAATIREMCVPSACPCCVRASINQSRAVGGVFDNSSDVLPGVQACIVPSDGRLDGVACLAGAGNELAARR